MAAAKAPSARPLPGVAAGVGGGTNPPTMEYITGCNGGRSGRSVAAARQSKEDVDVDEDEEKSSKNKDCKGSGGKRVSGGDGDSKEVRECGSKDIDAKRWDTDCDM